MPEQKSYEPSEEEIQNAKDSMTDNERDMSERREYDAHFDEREKAAQETLKKVFGNSQELIEEVTGKSIEQLLDNLSPHGLQKMAEAVEGVTYVTVSDIKTSSNHALMRLWNEMPVFGLDRNQGAWHPDWSTNGSGLVMSSGSIREIVSVLNNLNAVPEPIKGVGLGWYQKKIVFDRPNGLLDRGTNLLPACVFKIDTTPKQESQADEE